MVDRGEATTAMRTNVDTGAVPAVVIKPPYAASMAATAACPGDSSRVNRVAIEDFAGRSGALSQG